MEQHQQPDVPAYVEMVSKLNQAIFYCYNESSDRLPVNIVSNFSFRNEKTVCFPINYFPLTEKIWDVFAAELHFYKKGMPFSVVLHGIAVVCDIENSLVEFKIQNAEYFEQGDIADNHFLSSLIRPYLDFYRKGSELFSSTFSKKSVVNVLHNNGEN